MKRLSIILVSAIAVISLSLGALRYEGRTSAAETLPELLELAPADSTFIAYADVAALRQSSIVQQATSMNRPGATDPDYQEFVRATGFDYERDLDRVLVASKTDTTPNATIAVADGRFDQKKITEYAQLSGKTENENGRTVYVIPSVTPGKNISLTFLSAGRIAVSDGGDFFARQGALSTTPLDGAMRERLSRVAGAPLFFAAKTPARSTSAPSAGPAALASSLFQSVGWVDFAARPDGESVILSAEAECGSPEDALKVATALELLRTVIQGAIVNQKGGTQVPAENVAQAMRLLKAANITTAAERVRLLITLTPDMIKLPPSASSTKPAAH